MRSDVAGPLERAARHTRAPAVHVDRQVPAPWVRKSGGDDVKLRTESRDRGVIVRERGELVRYSPRRKFGFVRRDSSAWTDVMVLRSDVVNPGELAVGRRVEFELAAEPRGLRAVNVRVL
jgi:cold shock CspA family protein